MVDVKLQGEFDWIKTNPDRPEEFTETTGKVKKSWSAIIFPDKDSLEKIREMQAEGIKNKLKKDSERGWFCKFSIPTEKVNAKTGKITQKFTAPYVVDGEGKAIPGLVANQAKGSMVLDFYPHPAAGGTTSKAARLKGLILTEWKPYSSDAALPVNTEVKQANYF